MPLSLSLTRFRIPVVAVLCVVLCFLVLGRKGQREKKAYHLRQAGCGAGAMPGRTLVAVGLATHDDHSVFLLQDVTIDSTMCDKHPARWGQILPSGDFAGARFKGRLGRSADLPTAARNAHAPPRQQWLRTSFCDLSRGMGQPELTFHKRGKLFYLPENRGVRSVAGNCGLGVLGCAVATRPGFASGYGWG